MHVAPSPDRRPGFAAVVVVLPHDPVEEEHAGVPDQMGEDDRGEAPGPRTQGVPAEAGRDDVPLSSVAPGFRVRG